MNLQRPPTQKGRLLSFHTKGTRAAVPGEPVLFYGLSAPWFVTMWLLAASCNIITRVCGAVPRCGVDILPNISIPVEAGHHGLNSVEEGGEAPMEVELMAMMSASQIGFSKLIVQLHDSSGHHVRRRLVMHHAQVQVQVLQAGVG